MAILEFVMATFVVLMMVTVFLYLWKKLHLFDALFNHDHPHSHDGDLLHRRER